ncbi:MAG: YlbF family regulator, partial [Clostridia bacterium]|nr:YlbF family regulator [Clostridia bacterium]
MSLEKLTRELGKAIQQDERYLAMQKAIEANEKDTALN